MRFSVFMVIVGIVLVARSCPTFHQRGGEIIVEPCVDVVVVEDALGRRMSSCETPVRIYGNAYVTSEGCGQAFLGKIDCGLWLKSEQREKMGCGWHYVNLVWIIPTVLFVYIALSSLICLRKQGFLWRGGCLIKATDNHNIRVGVMRFILLSMCLKEVTGCVAPYNSFLLGSSIRRQYELSAGESICLGNEKITLEAVEAHYPLDFLYYTTSFHVEQGWSDWQCRGGACDMDKCAEYGSSGKAFEVKNSPDVTMKFCRFGHGCFLGTICMYDTLHFKMNMSGIHEVHKASFGKAQVIPLVDPSGKCKIEYIAQTSSTFFDEASIVVGPRDSYVCRVPALRGQPRVGALGDVQIYDLKGGSSLMDFPGFGCKIDSGHEAAACQNLVSFMGQVGEYCAMLPMTTDSGRLSIDITNSRLVLESDFKASLVANCPKGVNVKVHGSQCVGLVAILRGTIHGGFSSQVVLTSQSKDDTGELIVHSSCLSEGDVNLPCDGKPHYFKVTPETHCLFNGVLATDERGSFKPELSDVTISEQESSDHDAHIWLYITLGLALVIIPFCLCYLRRGASRFQLTIPSVEQRA